MTPDVRIQGTNFDPGVEIETLEAGAGGIATFTGIVRGGDGLEALEIEHYPGMTESALRQIAENAARRWPLSALTIVHRYGRLLVGERIVFVGAAAAHRGEAIEAMNYVIDCLKTDAPFWKCEHRAGGRKDWVEMRAEDRKARESWSKA